MHECPHCQATINDDTALCVAHANELRERLRDYDTLVQCLPFEHAGLAHHGPQTQAASSGAGSTRDAANPGLIDLTLETDQVLAAWATHYAGHPVESPLAWLWVYAGIIVIDHEDAAQCIDEITDALARLANAIDPPADTRSRSRRTCPLCGNPTRIEQGETRRCTHCHETLTPGATAAIMRLKAGALWLATPQLADFLEVTTGHRPTAGALRHRAKYWGVRRDNRGRWNAGDYLATLKKNARERRRLAEPESLR